MDPDSPKRFLRVQRISIEVIDRILVFLKEVDGETDSELTRQLKDIRAHIELMSCDPASLVPYWLPFGSDEKDARGNIVGYTDRRIDSMFEKAFPKGHRFHDVNKRCMLHDIAKIKHVAMVMQREISRWGKKGESNDASGPIHDKSQGSDPKAPEPT